MAIEVFNGTSIPRELTTAAMEFLWVKWKTLSDTNDLTLQRLTEECTYPLRSNSIHLLSAGDDFVYMYVGEAVQAAAGENLTGTLLSQQTNLLKREFADVYRQVAKRLTPAFVRFTATWSQSGQLWQRLVLPIRVADGTVILLVYSELINHQTEIYDHLFRTAPDAMVVACPITNDAGHTIDGWILMMNDRARQFLNFDGSIGNLRLTQLPQFAGIDLWGRIYAPKSAALVTPVRTADFDIEIMRFPHVFGLRIRPKSSVQDDTAATLVPDLKMSGILIPA
jgi:PAS domain-containing protein